MSLKNFITQIPKTELDIHFNEIKKNLWKTTIIHRLKQEKNVIKQLITTSTLIQTLLELSNRIYTLIPLI